MEEPKAFTTGIYNEQDDRSDIYNRSVPDVPDDVDFYEKHLNDPNFDFKVNRPLSVSTSTTYPKKLHIGSGRGSDTESQFDRYSTSHGSTAVDFDEESPYPEVRASVSSVDDPEMPVNTFRMWFLGLFFVIVVVFFNQIFSFRYPSIWITGIVIQLFALPLGRLMARFLPRTVFNFFGYKWSLNPGPFSIKEHVCITIMANAASNGVYIVEVTRSQEIFYGVKVPFSFQILSALGSQTFGYGLAGYLRQFVVYPSSMIWPGALVNSSLFNTLHKNYGNQDAGHMSRIRFFLIVVVASFIWYWVPGFLFTGLTFFSWVCWIAPTNPTVNALFGANTGLGMSILTFDWSMIAFIGSPLVTPWWAAMNTAVAFLIIFWIICPIIYFTNTWQTSFFPIVDTFSYDNTGLPYQVNDILTNGVFDQAKYSAYSPVFMTAAMALSYGACFAAFPAVFVHTFLWFRKDIVRRFRSTLKDERDIHSRLMQYYPDAPNWWYGIVGILSVIFLVVAIEINPVSQLPIWGLFLALGLSAVLSLPLAMLQAITNQVVPTQVMAELIIGYILPGKPMANMIFKSLAHAGSTQASLLSLDLKLGHYMKIPPRLMFTISMVTAVLTCFLVTGVQTWMFENVPDLCTPQQKDGFKCPGSRYFFTASVIWGGVGPAKLFSPGAMYSGLLWFFLIGAILPIPFYFLAKRAPLSYWRYVNIPIFFAGLGAIPPGTGLNYISWALVGFIFNFVIRKLHFRWWMRYNYILSAGLDAGLALSAILMFFSVQLPKGGVNLDWWGNTVWLNTADAQGLPLRFPEEGQLIGPSSWS